MAIHFHEEDLPSADLFAPGAPHIHAVPAQLVTPSQLGMVPAPGLASVPGSGTVRGC